MKWEFSSWGKNKIKNKTKHVTFCYLVPLVSKLCPNDTYKIYKSGK
jgi:hypothetical protein